MSRTGVVADHREKTTLGIRRAEDAVAISKGYVRPAAKHDIPQIVELCERVFGPRHASLWRSQKSYQAYVEDILFHSPWHDDALPSLVYQDRCGRIVGFLGVMPRRMIWRGRPIQAAISHHFMVDPGNRSTPAVLQLLKAFVTGPQDLSMADEATHTTRKLWEGLGGRSVPPYSIRWTRVLRPSRLVLSRLATRRLLAPVAFTLKPLADLVDAIAARTPDSPFRPAAPRVRGEDLDGDVMLAHWGEFASGRSLSPAYDARSLKWFLEILARMKRSGALQKVLVRNAKQQIVGWYLYHNNPQGVSEVVQVVGSDNTIEEVLDHLFYQACQQGCIALSGRADPRFLHAFLAKRCFLHGDGWLLVYSRNPELLQSLDRGEGMITRLEGEWPTGF